MRAVRPIYCLISWFHDLDIWATLGSEQVGHHVAGVSYGSIAPVSRPVGQKRLTSPFSPSLPHHPYPLSLCPLLRTLFNLLVLVCVPLSPFPGVSLVLLILVCTFSPPITLTTSPPVFPCLSLPSISLAPHFSSWLSSSLSLLLLLHLLLSHPLLVFLVCLALPVPSFLMSLIAPSPVWPPPLPPWWPGLAATAYSLLNSAMMSLPSTPELLDISGFDHDDGKGLRSSLFLSMTWQFLLLKTAFWPHQKKGGGKRVKIKYNPLYKPGKRTVVFQLQWILNVGVEGGLERWGIFLLSSKCICRNPTVPILTSRHGSTPTSYISISKLGHVCCMTTNASHYRWEPCSILFY